MTAVILEAHIEKRRQPADHIQLGARDITLARQLFLSNRWTIRNNSSKIQIIDWRLVLDKRNFFRGDDRWFEYVPGSGIITDEFRLRTGIASIGPAFAINIPPGDSTPNGIAIWPGPAASVAARDWWLSRNNDEFNWIMEVFHVPFNGATMAQSILIGSHVMKQFLQIKVTEASSLTALATNGRDNTGQQPRVSLQLFS